MQGLSIDREIGHGELSRALFATDDPDLMSVAKVLDELYQARQKSDYKMQPDEAWRSTLKSPKKARKKARTSIATINDLDRIDFAPLLAEI